MPDDARFLKIDVVKVKLSCGQDAVELFYHKEPTRWKGVVCTDIREKKLRQ